MPSPFRQKIIMANTFNDLCMGLTVWPPTGDGICRQKTPIEHFLTPI